MKQLFSVVIILSLLIALPLLAAPGHKLERADSKTQRMIPSNVWNKIQGPLKEAVLEYRSGARLEKKRIPAERRLKPAAVEVKSNSGKRTTIVRDVAAGTSLRDLLVLPSIQKRWNNPSFDVLKCLVSYKGDPKELKSQNLKVRTVSKQDGYNIVSVEIPSTEIENVAALAKVTRISPVLRVELENNRGTVRTKADKIRGLQAGMYKKGYTGAGVVVGLIDTGVDWSHGDFMDKSGNTRVAVLWDGEVDTPGQTPADVLGPDFAAWDYGTCWLKEDIDAGLCTAVDTGGHGSHVAGSMAGNGFATGEYAGMAPNATIVVCKGINAINNDGIPFIYKWSQMNKMPCAINMSYGYSNPIHLLAYYPTFFPADGTSDDCLQIEGWNEEYGQGNVPVRSGGNYGHNNSYANYMDYPYKEGGFHSGALQSAASTHTFNMPDYTAIWNDLGYGSPSANDWPFINIGMWYDSPVNVTFISPNGNTIGPFTTGDETVLADTVGYDGYVYAYMNYDMGTNGRYPAYFTFAGEMSAWGSDRVVPEPGEWQIVVEAVDGPAAGRVDMWTSERNYFFGFVINISSATYSWFTGDVANTNAYYIIGSETSDQVITVGWHNSKQWWPSILGGGYSYTSDDLDRHIADGSVPGPTVGGLVKPDIAGPGNMVTSVYSSQSSASDTFLAPDGQHVSMMGSSMAAPHVTGGIALMLEKHPRLNMRQVREMIKSNAKQDRYTDLYGERLFGYGKFTVKGLNDAPVPVIVASKDGGMVKFDAVNSYDPEGFPFTIEFKLEVEPLTAGDTVNYTYDENDQLLWVSPDMAVPAKYRVKVKVCDELACSEWTYSEWITVE